MAYRLKPHARIDREVKRVLKEEAEAAAEQLRNAARGDQPDEAIHEARKSVKKIRAVLRLVRPELGGTYREENARFRQIGQKLSALRDAGAMIETFDGLRKRYRDEVDPRVWDALHQTLLKRKDEAEQAVGTRQVFENYPRMLEAVAKKVEEWPLQGKGFSVIAPGLKAGFQGGREAMRRAQREPTPENFHEWRKRVKNHWYHVRLLGEIWGRMMEAYGNALKDLQTWLGDDHNLAVLRGLIEEAGGGFENLIPVIERHQTQLREQAFIAGVRVYRERPGRLVRRMEFLWNAPAEKEEILEELNG